MLDDRDILLWVEKRIDELRRNATHAYNRGDMTAFENINTKIRYFKRISEILEEKVNERND